MKFATRAIHIPEDRVGGAVAPPIRLSTTFEHGPANERLSEFEYIRYGNPNVNELEARLAALENGSSALVYASGMAATAALLSTLEAGSELLLHKDCYFDTRVLARGLANRTGTSHRVLDLRDTTLLEDALSENTALVWFETPSNPRLDVIDIARVAELAHAAGAKLAVDGTFATPAVQQPLEHGADYVMHSMTKYIGGHSDVQGGALVLRDDSSLDAALRQQRKVAGAVLSPFNAWLLSRGLQTLDCRVERHAANALAIAEMLSAHPAVERVNYPFLDTSPDRAIAAKQMRSGGGMLSVELAGGREAALRLASRVNLFVNATSLGGVESLIEHRASVEGAESTAPDNLLRLSVGLEHPDDLIADLEQAFG